MSLHRQSLWYYAPITLVLAAGYAVGGGVAFGVQFLGWFPGLTSEPGRFVLTLYAVGVLGATLYCSRWWALDYEDALDHPQVWPTALDVFGYAATIVGGGVTGVMFWVLAENGMTLASSAAEPAPLRPSVAVLVALVGGLTHFRVQTLLVRLFERATEEAGGKPSGSGAASSGAAPAGSGASAAGTGAGAPPGGGPPPSPSPSP